MKQLWFWDQLLILTAGQYPVITANEVPRDQRLPASRSYQGSSPAPAGGKVKKSRTHRKGRASGGEIRQEQNTSSSKSPKSADHAGPLQRNASSTSSHNSHRSQLVDLVVEDHEREEQKRVQAQREVGTDAVEVETQRFS